MKIEGLRKSTCINLLESVPLLFSTLILFCLKENEKDFLHPKQWAASVYYNLELANSLNQVNASEKTFL